MEPRERNFQLRDGRRIKLIRDGSHYWVACYVVPHEQPAGDSYGMGADCTRLGAVQLAVADIEGNKDDVWNRLLNGGKVGAL